MTERYCLVALTNPVPGQEDAYNDWYDNRHLDDVLAIPGFTRAQRYVQENAFSEEPAAHKYMAVYEFETADLPGTVKQFLERGGTDAMPLSPALGQDAVPHVYRVLGPLRERRPD